MSRSSLQQRSPVIVLAVILVWVLLQLAAVPFDEQWRIGDWLISYQGGFVRRGLIGELLIHASAWTQIDVRLLVKLLLLGLYALLFGLIAALVWPLRSTPALIALLASPAFLLFETQATPGAGRKELLLLVLLLIHLHRLLRVSDAHCHPLRPPAWLSLLLGLMVLSHEMLAAFLPYFVAASLLSADDRRQTTATGLWLCLLPGLLAAAVMLGFRGDAEVARGICQSLAAAAPADCATIGGTQGSISFLALGFEDSLRIVQYYNPPLTFLGFTLAIGLSAGPMRGLLRQIRAGGSIDAESGRRATLAVLAAIALSVPLMLVVSDYGRLIHIHVACISLLLVFALRRGEPSLPAVQRPSPGIWALVLLFALGWRLPYLSAFPQHVLWWIGALQEQLARG